MLLSLQVYFYFTALSCPDISGKFHYFHYFPVSIPKPYRWNKQLKAASGIRENYVNTQPKDL